MRLPPAILPLLFLFCSCQPQPVAWDGPTLTKDRAHLTVEELTVGKELPLADQSFMARPAWSTPAKHSLQGTLKIKETVLTYPKEKEFYPGEDIFPALQLDLLTHGAAIIPRNRERISTKNQRSSYWDVIVGTGEAWQEAGDGEWSRASFPLTLTDRWIGTARNCVASFVFKPDSISNICLQCSQETADIDDKGLANISGVLSADFQGKQFEDTAQIIQAYQQLEAARLPLRPLSEFDRKGEVANYFDRMIVTNAPTSLGAIFWNDTLFLHPPKTRHGDYPYPDEMRHGLYSVTKSMAGALSLLFLEERYEDDLFDLFITDYVPALADHPGWKEVTFAQTLNMVTGVDGGEDPERLLNTLIVAETADEAINNIARLPDVPALPGQQFNYASTNLFVLSYALQQYVITKEGEGVNYWDLVREEVLIPIDAGQFMVLPTIEPDSTEGIPILAYGALPTIDEAAKIALLFANEGSFSGKQLLARAQVRDIFGKTNWAGHSTGNDFRGSGYQHGFWSKVINANGCQIKATYMLGFGENYVIFLPSGAIIFRFLDEHDLDVSALIQAVEAVVSSCD
ncbi:MAG: serine hydrolase domain-containing protein [Lewinella sp.]